jgi:hypothetical protein
VQRFVTTRKVVERLGRLAAAEPLVIGTFGRLCHDAGLGEFGLWRFWQRAGSDQSEMGATAENECGAIWSWSPMVSRPLMLASLLGASIGVPYVVSKTSTPQQSQTGVPVATAAAPSPAAASSPPLLTQAQNYFFPTSQPATAPPAYPTTGAPAPIIEPPPVEPVRYHSLQEVLRFHVSKEWVYQNFDRKSTGLSDPQLFGIRVPLVTGTTRTDLAGSLTYLFDAQGQVQHISFRGRTADTTPLVQFLTQTYKFERMQAPAGEQLYQVRDGSRVYSELRTKPESVLTETLPLGSFGVVLELGRPGSNKPLQPQIPKLDIPEVAESAKPTADAAKTAGAAGEGEADSALVGSLRPATQAEHNQALQHRWPN